MRVLSIDWDYFINATDMQRNCMFPDGGNEKIGEYLSNVVWQMRYVQTRVSKDGSIEQFGINELAYDKIIRTFKKSSYYICCDSHKELGNFLLNAANDCFDMYPETIEIVNIDHHSDCYGNGSELDCGNWVNKVFEKYPKAKLTWICNNDSDVSSLDSLKDYDVTHTTSLDCLCADYDVVFLCRSGIWSPPHLDKYFRKLDRFLSKRCDAAVLREPMVDRWLNIEKDLSSATEHYKSALQDFKERGDLHV